MSQFARTACIGALTVAGAWAEDFSIQFASPVAAQSFQMKRSAFVFRTIACAPDAKAEVSATAEGLVNAQRRSMPLKVALGPAANVFGIFPEWPADGTWIVNIQARCGAKSAGALVATDGKGFVREASTVLDHPATAADIEASLKRGKKVDRRID